MPKVSVCIPTFNSGKFIGKAIESVLAQTLRDIEVIVVDNDSSDDTLQIVEKYKKGDPRISLYKNPTNIGMVNNWNKCLSYANSEYVKLLCSDDFISPECLERAVEILDKDEDVGLVTCARQVVDENLVPVKVLKFSCDSRKWQSMEVFKKSFEKLNPIGEPTSVVFRMRWAKRGFDNSFNQLADIEMWLNILQYSDMYSFSEVMCFFRQHNEQCTQKNILDISSVEDVLRLVSKYDKYLLETFGKRFRFKVYFMKCLYVYRRARYGLGLNQVRPMIDNYFGYKKFRIFYPFRKLIKNL